MTEIPGKQNEDISISVCILCRGRAKLFLEIKRGKYYQCGECSAVFLAPECYVSEEDEKRRYQEHNNNVEDPGYQKFVEPIVLKIQEKFRRGRQGLDFGAGTGPVAAKLLRDRGYVIELYDPYFYDNPAALEKTYDFIVCCEVI